MQDLTSSSPVNPSFLGPERDLRKNSIQEMGSILNHMKLGELRYGPEPPVVRNFKAGMTKTQEFYKTQHNISK